MPDYPKKAAYPKQGIQLKTMTFSAAWLSKMASIFRNVYRFRHLALDPWLCVAGFRRVCPSRKISILRRHIV